MRVSLALAILLGSSFSLAQTTDPALVPPNNQNLEVRPPPLGSPTPGGAGLVPPAPGGGLVPPAPGQVDQGLGVPKDGSAKAENNKTILQGIIEDYRYEP